MTDENPLIEDGEEDVSWKTIKEKWLVFLRLLLIISIVYIAFRIFYPYTKQEFKVYQKEPEIGYYAISEIGDGAFFTDDKIKDEFEIGDFVWVYYKKGDADMEVVKVRKR